MTNAWRWPPTWTFTTALGLYYRCIVKSWGTCMVCGRLCAKTSQKTYLLDPMLVIQSLNHSQARRDVQGIVTALMALIVHDQVYLHLSAA